MWLIGERSSHDDRMDLHLPVSHPCSTVTYVIREQRVQRMVAFTVTVT